MQTSGYVEKNWDIKEVKSLPFKLDYHKDSNLIKSYTELGHSIEAMTLYNCFEQDINLDLSIYKNQFTFLRNISIAVNFFKPGQYLPLHFDLYQKYKNYHNLNDNVNVVRIILMLEDSAPGQILQINDSLVGKWMKGQWYSWANDDLHAFYNLSKSDRYALQITGTID
jgi:hypothetical protein